MKSQLLSLVAFALLSASNTVLSEGHSSLRGVIKAVSDRNAYVEPVYKENGLVSTDDLSLTSDAGLESQWVLVALSSGDEDEPLVIQDDRPPTVSFKSGGSLSADDGCNGLGGAFEYLPQDNQISIDIRTSTYAMCHPPYESVASRFYEVLTQDALYYNLNGDKLTLNVVDEESEGQGEFLAQFTRINSYLYSVDGIELESKWELKELSSEGEDEPLTIQADRPPTVSFASDGSMSADDGCNYFGGTFEYVPQANQISIDIQYGTFAMCHPPYEPVASRFTDVLTQDPLYYGVNRDELTLYARTQGGELMVLARFNRIFIDSHVE